MWISTFHALCARLLRRDAPAIGLSRDFVIYDSSDQLSVVKQACRELQVDDKLVQPRAVLSRISHAKNRMEGPASLRDGWQSYRSEQMALIFEKYSAALDRRERARLRRPAAQDRGTVREIRTRAQPVRRAVPVRHDRRVSGHQPSAVSAHQTARRPPPKPLRRRRSGSVHLQVARRGPAQHS